MITLLSIDLLRILTCICKFWGRLLHYSLALSIYFNRSPENFCQNILTHINRSLDKNNANFFRKTRYKSPCIHSSTLLMLYRVGRALEVLKLPVNKKRLLSTFWSRYWIQSARQTSSSENSERNLRQSINFRRNFPIYNKQ